MKHPAFFVLIALALSSASAITPNSVELEIGQLIRSHSGQKRQEMTLDPVLNAVARAKASDLGKRKYWDHVDPDGFGPNRVVQQMGYALPPYYGSERSANFIESLGVGTQPYDSKSAALLMAGWLKSPDHREHVLGTDPVYAAQTHYGIGYANVANGKHRWYVVFISAPPPENGPGSGEYAEWLLQRFLPKSLEGTDDLTDHDGDGIPRIHEFVLGFEPYTSEALPSPVLSHDLAHLEWHLPLRQELGTVTWRIEHSIDLKSWTPDGVERNPNGRFSILIDHRGGFLRLITER